MKTDKIDDLFKELDFDNKEPASGHKVRFREKLEEQNRQTKNLGNSNHKRSLWAPLLSMAAILAIGFMVFAGFFHENYRRNSGELASVSPEMKETQQFYTQLIKTELETLKAEEAPGTEAIVKDALTQLEKLETEYKKLKQDLQKSGQDKRVVYAMISNFQQRIDLLNEVLNQIENIKTLKNQSDENYI
jgi:archaellum component FlaC